MIKAKDYDFSGTNEVCFEMHHSQISSEYHPLSNPPWEGVSKPITLEEIAACIREGRLHDDQVGPGQWRKLIDHGVASEDAERIVRKEHIERIAYLVEHPSDDAIVIDVGIPSAGYCLDGTFDFEDGFHRLAAAIYADRLIRVTFGGACSVFQELFPDSVLAEEKTADVKSFP